MAQSKVSVAKTMTETAVERENLEYLARTFGSQAALAAATPNSNLSQPKISLILRRKTTLGPRAARALEQDLKIPRNWLGRYLLSNVPLLLLIRFRELTPLQVELFNDMLAFVETNSNLK